jgi:hypothetical protein
MKSLLLPALVVGALALSPHATKADGHCRLCDCFAGLVNVRVDIHDINVTVNDVDIQDLVVVNVSDILNESDVSILENLINGNVIALDNQDILNNLLRDANIITDNETVVGVLEGGIIVVDVDP